MQEEATIDMHEGSAMLPSSVQSRKRRDIQGLRGIAIAAVLLYHLLPTFFSNGYLGVDVFFVISGYLMSVVLEKSSDLIPFYGRRFKRIVPLYAYVLFLVTATVPFVFLRDDLPEFEESLKWALPFAGNMQSVVHVRSYYEEVFNYPLLLHAWSLGVEIQYYLIVPFLLRAQRKCTSTGTKLALMLALVAVSLLLQLLLPPSAAFGLMPCRIWQFTIGGLAHFLESAAPPSFHKTDYEESSLSRAASLGPLLLLLVIIFVVSLLDAATTRIAITLLSGLVILSGSSPSGSTRLHDNAALEYLGDLSYTVYLLHWPHAGTALHHGFDEECSILYAAIIVVLYSGALAKAAEFRPLTMIKDIQQPAASKYSPEFLRKAAEWNLKESKKTFHESYIVFEEEPLINSWVPNNVNHNTRGVLRGSGTAKVLLIGNSFAHRAAPALLEAFAGRFSEMRLFTHSCASVLTDNSTIGVYDVGRKIVHWMQPDITFIIESDPYNFQFLPINGSLEDDNIVRIAQSQIDFYSAHSGAVVVEYQFYRPQFDDGVAYTIAKRIQQGRQDFEDLRVSYAEYVRDYENAIVRIDALHAKNLIRSRIQEAFCDMVTDDCPFFDPSSLHSFYSDQGAHLSPDGLRLIVPHYKKIIDAFLDGTIQYNDVDERRGFYQSDEIINGDASKKGKVYSHCPGEFVARG